MGHGGPYGNGLRCSDDPFAVDSSVIGEQLGILGKCTTDAYYMKKLRCYAFLVTGIVKRELQTRSSSWGN